jgi:hypothetical protein
MKSKRLIFALMMLLGTFIMSCSTSNPNHRQHHDKGLRMDHNEHGDDPRR